MRGSFRHKSGFTAHTFLSLSDQSIFCQLTFYLLSIHLLRTIHIPNHTHNGSQGW